MFGTGLDCSEEISQAPAKALASLIGTVRGAAYADQIRATLIRFSDAGLVDINEVDSGQCGLLRLGIDFMFLGHLRRAIRACRAK